MLIAVSLIIFFAILIFFYWLLEVIFVKERYIERLNESDPEKRVVESKALVQKVRKSPMSGLAKLVPKGKNNKISDMLMKANLSLTAEELFIYRLLFSIALGFLSYAIRRDYIFTSIVVIIVWNSPKFLIKRRIKKRLEDFDLQLNGALALISNALKAGHSFMQAVSIAARETQGTFSDEFKILLKELNFGIPIEVGFENLLKRVGSSDMKLVVNAILIQKDIGGNLSEILENIASTIRDRQTIQNEMKTLTAQGKMSGMIVMLLPVFLGGVIYLMNPEYMMVLFTTKIGLGIVAVAVVNELIGIVLIRKIISIEV
jgi:tight adherence protein B